MSNNKLYKVIKQIGKGSFSDVYLCEKKSNEMITLFNLESTLFKDFFIIKRININSLVDQYVRRERFNDIPLITTETINKSAGGLNKSTFVFTPPNVNYTIKQLSKGVGYYRKKLTDVIRSEIRILKLLDDGSENIIKYYDHEIYENNNGHNIYDIHLEYCNGGDLYSYLKGGDSILEKRNKWGGFSKRFLYEFINQISNGLKFIHDSNLIHRDIKLQNILINFNLEKYNVIFKISDLGFACYDVTKLQLIKHNIDIEKETDYLVSKYYKICGTPYYMAPEILLGKNKIENASINYINYDYRIDIWSFGISIYQLIWNKLPFIVRSVKQLEHIYSNKEVNLNIQKDCITKTLEQILNYTICINRAMRYTADELIKITNDFDGYKHWDGDNKPIEELITDLENCKNKQENKCKNKEESNKEESKYKNKEEDWEKISEFQFDSEFENLKNLNIDTSFLDWMKRTN